MRISALACAVSAIAITSTAPALAQDAAEAEAIVVTGTLIRSSAEDAPAPVEVIGGEELARQGNPSIIDLARRLPVSAGVIGDSSQFDPRSQFNQGSASVNLRGLGPQRTLVLLNGKRMVQSGAGNLPLVDVNLLPTTAIDRIEILKDGGAATYGSDAIAGVVNFITRTQQDGFLASADYRLIDGSKGDYSGALSWGGDLGDARLFLSGGYQHRSELRATDRDWAIRPFAENPQGGYSGGGNPGNFDFDAGLNGIAFTADEGCEALGGFRSLAGSSGDLCSANYLGFTNFIEPEDRFQLFGDFELPVDDATTIRVTGLYGRTETVLTTSPSFLPTIAPSANAAFGGSGLFVIPAYAPALADYCARYGADAGCAISPGSTMPTAPALAYPVRFRPFLLGGNPLFDNQRGASKVPRDSDAYQLVAEMVTQVPDSLEWRSSLTYSEYDRRFTVSDTFVDLFQNALAGFGGPDCAYADPRTRTGLDADQLAAIAGTGGCTFFNPFSTGVPGNAITGVANPNYAANGSPLGLSTTPGAGLVNDIPTIDQFFNIWERTANTNQLVAESVLGGGSGIRLPGGEVEFAVGAQYRQDRYSRTYESGNNLDDFPCPGSVLNPRERCNPEPGALGFIGSNRNVSVNSDVWALFAEVQAPITDRITAQVAARFENYGGSVGSTFDPQLRLRYEATDWLTLRGGVGTTFRGPPPQNTSADLVVLTFIGGAFRAVDLLGNPDLAPETATTWNAGAIVDTGPFRASLDYWRYDFSGPIENEPVGGIVAAMFGGTGSEHCDDPAYAGLQARFSFAGGTCSAANVQRLATFAVNSADVLTSGLDAQASYDFDLEQGVLQLGAQGSYVFDYKTDAVVVEGIEVQPAYDAVGKLNYQTTAYPLPRYKGSAWVQAVVGRHSLRLQANHIAGYTDQRGDAVFGPNGGTLAGAVVSEGKEIGSWTTLDATWLWRLPTRTTLSVNLSNITDEDPPFARLDQNFDPFTADALGFTAKLGIAQEF